MNMRLKKWILPNLPYVGIALFATKLGQTMRIAPGADFSGFSQEDVKDSKKFRAMIDIADDAGYTVYQLTRL